ncbi:MAG: bifunctional [glutamate--ammonia ligase]-adenylyl-L-tyrosine phosphorylase/[glutamate--ammonia-ligase] adenylyltransferase [Nitrospirae bacterium CG01_land_8_20_14_3_00_44_22]|nr:MAG: bifunctional [glutamate--ammonia ligase]-adenylyl-L-tyrosine phosphorylase/[glutamate--ammonia-ligase] adenylyltransferase [Nitrospirae bacterium CG01_land_8_20_14_3_00_44_22]PJA82578.1 MAG: bifunctional [glutamate--ammonia ligase]-adenylyl-L-tyrosine phosphorylase/[glutamate--ammonia-ligase] adenylyltransferase [Nitrospirae bacterium CG_4_9_14_3_um_filter_44_28]
MQKMLRDAAQLTPDTERTFKNLTTFSENNPDYIDKLKADITPISLLFSYSQFLANFCISNPEILFDTLAETEKTAGRESLSASLRKKLTGGDENAKVVCRFKKKELLRITLRDILKKADLTETMLELSILADVIVNESLKLIKKSLTETYGEPEKDAFTVISVGKLGSEELNFSSDIDIMFVYGTADGETSGITTPQGITANRITNHEYYCKLGENLNRFLSANTEDGFIYRVDLRLRPEGQRGSIALPVSGYETYYESWGRAWERAMLLRARPIAGDSTLGSEFMEMIKPFVYRKYLDFSAIDEIRQIKTRIDSAFKKNDIKRGYGGIREIEFFAQALQLIYAGKEPLLRERITQKALHMLLQKNLIGQTDYSALLDNYRFLRMLEHRLQQMNDLQTHSLPADEKELNALGRKMGFSGRESFLKELDARRKSVRTIYNSLFREEEKEQSDGAALFDEELSDPEVKEYLGKIGVKDVERGLRNIQLIKNSTYNYQTLRGRRLLGEILPSFVDAAVKSSNPDMALNHLQSFASFLSAQESYLDTFKENKELIPVLTNLFSQSEYISKAVIRRPDYLELIGHEMLLKKSLKALKIELRESIESGMAISDAIRLMRQVEEIRLSLLFLEKKINVIDLIKGLSRTAGAILSVSIGNNPPLPPFSKGGMGGFSDRRLALIGFGKLGGREITFNSDMDIIFASMDDVTEEDTKAAERLLRLLISYTREGAAYRVDMRLRPDGTKGPLVSSIASFRDYYSKNAAFWEFQALLKARPVAGDRKTGQCFLDMAKDILIANGKSILASDVRGMRERIQRELSKETAGYDIKLGYGGLEELEFTVQYLQLRNCAQRSFLLVQNTLDAIRRLHIAGVINESHAESMKGAYIFYRTLESYLRLRERDILKKDDEDILTAAEFLGFKGKDELIGKLDETRAKVRDIYNLLVV